MLRVAVVADTYHQGRQFILAKFSRMAYKYNEAKSEWVLNNGDIIQLCYISNKSAYRGMEFDAMIDISTRESALAEYIHMQIQHSGVLNECKHCPNCGVKL